MYATETVGEGPRWHVHPYDEVFILRSGRALFTIGDKKIQAQAGDMLMGPAHLPHKDHNPALEDRLGSVTTRRAACVHATPHPARGEGSP